MSLNEAISVKAKDLGRIVTVAPICAGVFALTVFLACGFQSIHEPEMRQGQGSEGSGLVQYSDDDLMALVKQIAADSDRSSAAWKTLSSYPRQDLVTRLQKLMAAMPEDDRRRVAMMFVFCFLDYDYEGNSRAIVRALVKEPRVSNPDADWELQLVHRLVERGDSHLLPVLFETVFFADGAMAAGLSGYLVFHLRTRPEQFLDELKGEPPEIRRGVYDGVLEDELLTKEGLASIMRSLESVPKGSPTYTVAHEMLVTLRKGSQK
jgi:hypothetical protein